MLILVSQFTVVIPAATSVQNVIKTNQLEIHNPILISSNSDFTERASTENWPGSGTQNNPYIIESLNFKAEGAVTNLIHISNTNVYFIIRDCVIQNGGSPGEGAVYLNSITNGKLINNSIVNNGFIGILLIDSNDNELINNTIYDNEENGVELRNSNSNKISSNIISNNKGDGLQISSSNHNVVNRNTFYENSNFAIHLVQSSNNLMYLNIIPNNTYDGIVLEESSNYNTIHNNVISNTGGDGIQLSLAANYNTISNNGISNATDGGIDLDGSSHVAIYNNTVYNNLGDGIHLQGSSNFIDIYDNAISNNGGDGIQLTFSSSNTISRNAIYNNSDYGIHFRFEPEENFNTHVEENSFIQNNIGGDSQAYDESEDRNYFGYNHWSDWLAPDNNNDGVVDVPYAIEGGSNFDYFPVVNVYDTSIISHVPLIFNQREINGNEEFIEFVDAEGLTGNGTISHPYLIKNYLIRDQTLEWVLNNIDLHITIINCSFNNIIGFSFQNIANVKITNNVFSELTQGIMITQSSNVEISENIITNGDRKAISIQNSIDCSVVNNTISDNYHGIELRDSTSNTISYNRLTNNLGFGLNLQQSPSNSIQNNTFLNCLMEVGGSNLQHSLQTQVSNNTINDQEISYMQKVSNIVIIGNPGQIFLINCDHIEIAGLELFAFNIQFSSNIFAYNNTFLAFSIDRSSINLSVDQSMANIRISASDKIVIHNNTISQGEGIIVFHSIDVTVSSNLVTDCNNYGIISWRSPNIIIEDNIVYNNSREGIYLFEANYNSLQGNLISFNEASGIHLEKSNSTTIIGNNISNNFRNGIDLSDSENSHLTSNTIEYSGDAGILVLDSTNTSIRNTFVINNLHHGITVQSANVTNLINNTIKDNGGSGLYTSNTRNGTLIGNTIKDNGESGIYEFNTINGMTMDNSIQNNFGGIVILYGVESFITGNSIANNSYYGISLDRSVNSSVTHNRLMNNLFNVQGEMLDHFLVDEFLNNTVDGKAIIYWQNMQNEAILQDSGQVFLVNSNSIEISKISSYNIYVFYCTDVQISDNEISWDSDSIFSLYAINLLRSHANTISNNVLKGSGIYLYDSTFNKIHGNTVIYAKSNGLDLSENSNFNILTNNVIYEAVNVGISIFYSFNNDILWNDFINSQLLYCQGCSQVITNTVGNKFSYNYWSEWVSPDKNYDCIVDNKYQIATFSLGYEIIRIVDETPVTQPIAKSNAIDNDFCRFRAQINSTIKKYKTPLLIIAVLILLLVLNRIRRRILKPKEDKSDLYPNEGILNSNNNDRA
jgi:parallel beta-helix repeat protein